MTTRPGNRSALLVIDVQVGVVAQAFERDRVVANVAIAVRRARGAGVPVIWVQHHEDELKPGSPEWEIVPELQPAAGELRIHKSHQSSFEGTELLAELDRLGVSRLFIAGASTNWCIRATAYASLERGFDVTLLGDAHTTSDMEPAPGRVIQARGVIDDLNTVMQWISYPGRTSAVKTVDEAQFG